MDVPSRPARKRPPIWLQLIVTLFFTCFAAAVVAQRSPRFDCVNCEAPNGGLYRDHGGNPWCPDCFGKEFGAGAWNEGMGAYTPRPGSGGGGAGGGGWRGGGGGGGGPAAGCDASCHGGGAGRGRRDTSVSRNKDRFMPNDPVHVLSAATAEGRINPHGGIELTLMLDGTKPMAMFGQTYDMQRSEVGDGAFANHVAEGRLIYREVYYPNEDYTRHYYALPDESWRIKAMDALQQTGSVNVFPSFTMDDYYRMVGFLLGYTKDDVDLFILRTRERREGLLRVE